MSTYTPEIELRRRVVNLLRADAILNDTTTGLLFPASSPYAGPVPEDERILATGTDVPGPPEAVSRLPRLTVEAIGWPTTQEQEDPAVLRNGVKLWTHTTVAADDEQLGAAIDARVRTLLLSTWLTDARIITPRLSLDGNSRREKIEGLNGAWELVSGFSATSVGSLL